jgi:hypothetical protein
MIKWSPVPTLALVALLGHSAIADGGDSVEISRPVLTMFQEVTHIVKGGDHINTLGGLDKAWLLPTSGSLDFQMKMNGHLGLEVMVAGIYYSAPYHYDLPQNYVRSLALSAPRLDASYTFGEDPAHPSLRIDAGVFAHKYNEYSRDLGEYMFRTWAYPGVIFTGGTYNYMGVNGATVTGLKFSQTLGMFSHDLIASVETEMTPVYDLNLTYMAKFNFNNILKIGGGVQLARILSAGDDDGMTVQYFQYSNGQYYVSGSQGSAYYSSLRQGIVDHLRPPKATAEDTARFLSDSVAQTKDMDTAIAVLERVSTGDLKPSFKDLTAKAIKPVFYFSFDPKPLIGSSIFGAKDLVLYGEAALLGAQNYPVFYNSMMRRVPLMVGFNVPAFKVLDVLSVEMEYYASRWLPTYDAPQNLNGKPNPFMALQSYYPSDWDKDNIKWSVYAERMLVHGLTISGQMASDHSRSWDWVAFGKTPWEIYTTPSQFYWSVKLGIKI